MAIIAGDPTSISGLDGWWNVQNSAISQTNGKISQWNDLSGLGNHATQATAGVRPLWTPGADPYVHFDGIASGSCWMAIPAGLVQDTQNSTVVFCLRHHTVADAAIYWAMGPGAQAQYLAHTGTANPTLSVGDAGSNRNSGIVPETQLGVVAFVMSAANVVCYSNMKSAAVTAMGVHSLAGGQLSGFSGSASLCLTASLKEVIHYNTALTASQIQALVDYLCASHNFSVNTTATINVVVDGDSLTYGSYATYGRTWLNQAGFELGRRVKVHSIGFSGKKVTDAQSKFSTYVTPQYDANAASNCYIIWLGTNDIASTPASGAATYANLQALVATARAAGFDKIIIGTLAGRGSATGFPTEGLAYNALIRAGGLADAIADIGADPNIGIAAANYNSAIYYADAGAAGLHFTNFGYSIPAGSFRRAFDSIYNPIVSPFATLA